MLTLTRVPFLFLYLTLKKSKIIDKLLLVEKYYLVIGDEIRRLAYKKAIYQLKLLDYNKYNISDIIGQKHQIPYVGQKILEKIKNHKGDYYYEQSFMNVYFNKKRNIFVIKPFYLALIIDDLETIMPYGKGSSQYVSPGLVRGENIRLFQ